MSPEAERKDVGKDKELENTTFCVTTLNYSQENVKKYDICDRSERESGFLQIIVTVNYPTVYFAV